MKWPLPTLTTNPIGLISGRVKNVFVISNGTPRTISYERSEPTKNPH